MLKNLVLAIALLPGSGVAVAQETAADAQHPAGLTREAAPVGAEVFFVEPADGATVGRDVHMKFGVKGIAVAATTAAAPNSGHHHLLIDAAGLPALDAPIPVDATHKHYGKGQTEDTIQLEPGTHTLQLDFGDLRHMQFDPPLVSRKITIHVK